MTLKPLKTVGFTSSEAARFQEYVADAIGSITSKAILDGRILAGVSLVSGSVNNISHLLGRSPLGYIVTTRSVDCRIWDDLLTTTLAERFLPLRTNANVTVNLWVF